LFKYRYEVPLFNTIQNRMNALSAPLNTTRGMRYPCSNTREDERLECTTEHDQRYEVPLFKYTKG